MAELGKVTCFITRLGRDGVEVCVFEHPRAGIQLPAGTVEPGEDHLAAARREAFEETGLEPLHLVGVIASIPAAEAGVPVLTADTQVGGIVVPRGYYARVLGERGGRVRIAAGGAEGVVDRAVLSYDGVRQLVHFTYDGPSPQEWWVMTPDGGGLCWRCHWVGVDRTGLSSWHQRWLELARGDLVAAQSPVARERDLGHAGDGIEIFFAPPWPGDRVIASWLEREEAPPESAVARSEAIAITAEGQLVAIEQWAPGLLSFPGGRREVSEAPVDTLRRELEEEACATLERWELLGYQRFAHLLGDRIDRVTTDAVFWARVSLRSFSADFETTGRRLLDRETARTVQFWAHPVAQRLLDRAFQVEDAFAR